MKCTPSQKIRKWKEKLSNAFVMPRSADSKFFCTHSPLYFSFQIDSYCRIQIHTWTFFPFEKKKRWEVMCDILHPFSLSSWIDIITAGYFCSITGNE
jgi:hypothetical protein